MNIRYNDISLANYGIDTVNIKGKEYVQVNQRVLAFRKVYPEGFIETEIISWDDTACVFKATCGYTDGMKRVVLGTGHAREEKASSYINKQSYIENCETSAIGRALGMAGFGIDASIASYDEVSNSMENQEKAVELEKEYIKLRGQLSKLGVDIRDDDTVVEYIQSKAKVSTLDNGSLSVAEMKRVIDVFKEIIEKKNANNNAN